MLCGSNKVININTYFKWKNVNENINPCNYFLLLPIPFRCEITLCPKTPVLILLVEKMAKKGACEKKYCEINENPVRHSSLFFFLFSNFLLQKLGHLSCQVSLSLIFADCISMMSFNVFLCPLHFL